MNDVTTTKNGFRTEDVTFRHARQQSEIDKEISHNIEQNEEDIQVPVSLTPEQVVAFYLLKIQFAKDSNEKRLYSQTISWIEELQKTKKELIALKNKEELKNATAE